jgi:cell filamentation protein
MSDVLGYTYDPNGKYCYRGTSVLVNKFGIEDEAGFDAAKAEAVSRRYNEIVDAGGINGRYNLKHLREFHRLLFQDVYDWAGELRTVNISGGLFCEVASLEKDAELVFLRLENEDYLKGLSPEDMAESLSRYSYEIDRLHPFRGGNFTTTKAFLTQMGLRVGYKLDYSIVSEDEIDRARLLALKGDKSGLEGIYRAVALKIPREKK